MFLTGSDRVPVAGLESMQVCVSVCVCARVCACIGCVLMVCDYMVACVSL